VIGSDGLWDNLFDVKVIDLIRPFIRDTDVLADPELIAEVIATEAERFSNQSNYLSPFAKGAREAYYDYIGGKPDDITIIVAQVMLAQKDSKRV
jgi:protein phosphatase PTC7